MLPLSHSHSLFNPLTKDINLSVAVPQDCTAASLPRALWLLGSLSTLFCVWVLLHVFRSFLQFLNRCLKKMTINLPCSFFPSNIICLLRGATISNTGHSFSLLMETWKQIGMVPGCQPDSLASRPLLFGRFRAQWQIKLLSEREVYREPVWSQMVSLLYDHYSAQSIFTWQRYVQVEKPQISKLSSV